MPPNPERGLGEHVRRDPATGETPSAPPWTHRPPAPRRAAAGPHPHRGCDGRVHGV